MIRLRSRDGDDGVVLDLIGRLVGFQYAPRDTGSDRHRRPPAVARTRYYSSPRCPGHERGAQTNSASERRRKVLPPRKAWSIPEMRAGPRAGKGLYNICLLYTSDAADE